MTTPDIGYSDRVITILLQHGLVEKTANREYNFISRRLGFKCPSCGRIIPHEYADGGLYVTCDPCRTNWILYFGFDDLANHLEKGSVVVLDGVSE